MPIDTILLKIGNRIKTMRKQKKLSQEEFAHLVGVDRSYMGSIERGERNITIITLFKIIVALETSFHDFFDTKL